MNFIEWYLNLSFWQACLVWLKLLLPVLFGLIVFALIVIAARLFSGSLNVPKNVHSNRAPKNDKPMVQ